MARELQTCTFERPGASNTTKIPREDPQREEENEFSGGRGKKKARNFGPHPSGPHPSGPHPSGPHPSGPHPSGPHPSGPHPFRPPLFLGLGPTLLGSNMAGGGEVEGRKGGFVEHVPFRSPPPSKPPLPFEDPSLPSTLKPPPPPLEAPPFTKGHGPYLPAWRSWRCGRVRRRHQWR